MMNSMEKEELNQNRVKVGQMLKARREREGWTMLQVAKMCDLTELTVRKMEAGVFNVPLDILTKIADVYGCDIYFFKRKED